MKTKNLIIWCWLSWIVLARLIAEKWEEVLIVEKRNHIWWNCYDYNENGILVHLYWPHIFHTNFPDVWNFVNRFSKFTNYKHKVLALIDWKFVPVPFNLNSIDISFSKDLSKKLKETLLKYFQIWDKVSITELRKKAKDTWDENLNFLANYIFEKVFKNYTIKQWWITVEEIDQNVLKRVPIIISTKDWYFSNDKFQWMPKFGYTNMFKNMLNHKNIKVKLNIEWEDIKDKIEYEKLYFTWPIDEFFDYKFWKLEYRKTLYKFETYKQKSFQKNAVINFPNDFERTRITEFKHFYKEKYQKLSLGDNQKIENKTIICKEIPWIWEIEAYPMETNKNLEILEKYKKEAEKLQNVKFVGRLANFKYYDMDDVIKNILDLNFQVW